LSTFHPDPEERIPATESTDRPRAFRASGEAAFDVRSMDRRVIAING
jgi:hypothetical protein